MMCMSLLISRQTLIIGGYYSPTTGSLICCECRPRRPLTEWQISQNLASNFQASLEATGWDIHIATQVVNNLLHYEAESPSAGWLDRYVEAGALLIPRFTLTHFKEVGSSPVPLHRSVIRGARSLVRPIWFIRVKAFAYFPIQNTIISKFR
jgi:hypothetical protein